MENLQIPKEEHSIIEELKRVAHEHNATRNLSEFFIYAMSFEEIRRNITDDQVSVIFFLNQILQDVEKLPD